MNNVIKNGTFIKFKYRLTSILALLTIWWLVSLTNNIVPTPHEVAIVSYQNIVSGSVSPHFLATFFRIIVSLFFSMLIGLIAGIPMGLFRKVELYLDTWVLAGIMIPATSYGVIILIIFGLNNFAAIAAITITTCPVIIVSIWKGVKILDNNLNEMARTFRMPWQQRVLRVVIPQLYPAIMSSLRYGLSIIWKVTVVIELIGLTSGIGYMLMYWFSLFRMQQVLSWTLMFTIIIIILEWTVLSALEKKVLGWQEEVKV
jgi:NitT/TauT family transport system permease protein